jgi:hypothetical protein
MEQYLIDKLFIKRFCLPIDANIEEYEQGKTCVNSNLCSQFNHVACIFTKKRILNYGINKMGNGGPGIHAEYDAIKKLCPLRKRKRCRKVDLLVVRLSQKNKLQMSKPCYKCIETIKYLPNKLGYNIQNIYYSDESGNIVKSNLNALDNGEKHYSRFVKRSMVNINKEII